MANSKKPAPSELADYLKSRLQALAAPGRHVCLALSGGVDSVVLLHLLLQLQPQLHFSLSALHVNHQLSAHAPAGAAFCADLCAQYAVPLHVHTVHVPRRSKLGLEGAARAARYQVFSRQECDLLLLAHHLDDQAETLLQNLLRGTGLAGAAGMMELRTHADAAGLAARQLARPLLAVPRSTLLAYARKHRLPWVEDESNANTAFARNFLRHEVLPRIAQRFPAYRETLARATAHFAEAECLLGELAALDMQRVVQREKLQLQDLAQLSAARAMNVLRAYLSQQGIPNLERDRLQEWLRQLLAARGDRQIVLDVGDLCLRRYRNQAWIEPLHPEIAGDWAQAWQGQRHLLLPELHARLEFGPCRGGGISREKLQRGSVVLRLRQGSEKLRVHCRRPRRLLKHLLQEAGVPAWQRGRLPLLYCDEQLVAVPGIGIDCAFQAGADEAGWQLLWQAL